MTIATDNGFKIGELYRVKHFPEEYSNPSYYTHNMIVRFTRDDSSNCPWFEYVSGPVGERTHHLREIRIFLWRLEPLVVSSESIKSNKDLLKLYVKQHHPLDSTLIALVESI